MAGVVTASVEVKAREPRFVYMAAWGGLSAPMSRQLMAELTAIGYSPSWITDDGAGTVSVAVPADPP